MEQPVRVLVVDDDPTLRRYLSVLLGRDGYLVDAVSTAAAAQDRLASGPPYDVVLLDARLADAVGTEFAAQLIDDPPTSRLPICFITGTVHGQPRTAAGIACLGKPATPGDIRARLLSLLDWSRGGGSSAADRHAALARLREHMLV